MTEKEKVAKCAILGTGAAASGALGACLLLKEKQEWLGGIVCLSAAASLTMAAANSLNDPRPTPRYAVIRVD